MVSAETYRVLRSIWKSPNAPCRVVLQSVMLSSLLVVVNMVFYFSPGVGSSGRESGSQSGVSQPSGDNRHSTGELGSKIEDLTEIITGLIVGH